MHSLSFVSHRGSPRAAPRVVRASLVALACTTGWAAASPSVQAASLPARLGLPEYQVVLGINEYRAQYGLAPLQPSRALTSAAHAHSADMVRRRYYGHNTLNGWAWSVRIKRYVRARMVGETLDLLYGGGDAGEDPSRVVNDWIQSPRHRAVMLTRRFRRVGVARAALDGGRPTFFTADYSS